MNFIAGNSGIFTSSHTYTQLHPDFLLFIEAIVSFSSTFTFPVRTLLDSIPVSMIVHNAHAVINVLFRFMCSSVRMNATLLQASEMSFLFDAASIRFLLVNQMETINIIKLICVKTLNISFN